MEHYRCGLPVTITKSPYSTSLYYKGVMPDHAHLSPLLSQGDLLSYSMSVTVLLYSFSETARSTNIFLVFSASKKLLAIFWAV